MKLTQLNIDCMSKSLGLDPLLVHPMDVEVDLSPVKTMWIHNPSLGEERLVGKSTVFLDGWVLGRLHQNTSGGRKGVYGMDRSKKAVQTRRENGKIFGRTAGYKHTNSTKLKIKNNALKHVEKSKQKLAFLNISCSCVICKKQTSVLWLNKKHNDCKF